MNHQLIWGATVATKFVSERNIKYLLYEVFDVESLTSYQYFSEHNRKMFDMVLKAAVKLGKDLMFPIFEKWIVFLSNHKPMTINDQLVLTQLG